MSVNLAELNRQLADPAQSAELGEIKEIGVPAQSARLADPATPAKPAVPAKIGESVEKDTDRIEKRKYEKVVEENINLKIELIQLKRRSLNPAAPTASGHLFESGQISEPGQISKPGHLSEPKEPAANVSEKIKDKKTPAEVMAELVKRVAGPQDALFKDLCKKVHDQMAPWQDKIKQIIAEALTAGQKRLLLSPAGMSSGAPIPSGTYPVEVRGLNYYGFFDFAKKNQNRFQKCPVSTSLHEMFDGYLVNIVFDRNNNAYSQHADMGYGAQVMYADIHPSLLSLSATN